MMSLQFPSPSSLRRSVATSLPDPSSATDYRLLTTDFSAAFSLVEIMFAVMILGIGFIMIAAIFPVAIEQSQATVAETTGTIVAENGMRAIKTVPLAWYNGTSPYTNPPFTGTKDGAQWNWGPLLPAQLGSQQISTIDPRFAYISFGYKTTGSTYNVVTIAVTARNTPTFPPNSRQYDLAPPAIAWTPIGVGAGPHTAQLTNITVQRNDFGSVTFVGGDTVGCAQAVEGAYLLVYDHSPLNGAVLQVGTFTGPGKHTYSLLPVTDYDSIYDPNHSDGKYDYARAIIIGRGLRYPDLPFNAVSNPYEGPCMAVHASPMQLVTPQ